jgi:hypothetical protein
MGLAGTRTSTMCSPPLHVLLPAKYTKPLASFTAIV